MFVVVSSAVVGFLSVLIGRWLHLDYSAKLWAMTFVLVVMVRTFEPCATGVSSGLRTIDKKIEKSLCR